MKKQKKFVRSYQGWMDMAKENRAAGLYEAAYYCRKQAAKVKEKK